MQNDPKPCPFCGQHPDPTDGDFCYPVNRERTIFRAGCIEAAGGCGAEVLGDSPEHAIKLWNTRVKPESESLGDMIQQGISNGC